MQAAGEVSVSTAPRARRRRATAYELGVRLNRVLARAFFRRAEVTGVEHVPGSGGGIVVAWHPNALLDGGLILAHFPRPIAFGARHGLFRWPLLGALMRSLRMVPVYRRQDFPDASGEEARRLANERSLDALARVVAAGGFVGLFPEGDSHDNPHPSRLKTGAARIYERALELTGEGQPPPAVLPVGLHYDRKRLFRSGVLVSFHPPLDLPPELRGPPPGTASEEERHARVGRLTDVMEQSLRDVAHATESWELHHALHRVRKLLRAEWAQREGVRLSAPDMRQRVRGFSRVWEAYQESARRDPEATRSLVDDVREYDAALRALEIEDHELDRAPRLVSPWLAFILGLQALLVYLVLPPILVVGYLVNLPAGALVWITSRLASRKPKDEASIKLLLGAVLFPATWLLVAVLVAWGHSTLGAVYPEVGGSPLLTGLLALLLSGVGAWVALDYHRLATQTLRALRLRFTHLRRRSALEHLRAERARLYDALLASSRPESAG